MCIIRGNRPEAIEERQGRNHGSQRQNCIHLMADRSASLRCFLLHKDPVLGIWPTSYWEPQEATLGVTWLARAQRPQSNDTALWGVTWVSQVHGVTWSLANCSPPVRSPQGNVRRWGTPCLLHGLQLLKIVFIWGPSHVREGSIFHLWQAGISPLRAYMYSLPAM